MLYFKANMKSSIFNDNLLFGQLLENLGLSFNLSSGYSGGGIVRPKEMSFHRIEKSESVRTKFRRRKMIQSIALIFFFLFLP